MKLEGKRTYLVAILFLAGVIVPVAFGVIIPEWIFGILGALGLGALRLAISSVNGNKGWKTYVSAVAVAGVSIASGLGVVLPLDIIYGVLGSLGVVGVRDAVDKLK